MVLYEVSQPIVRNYIQLVSDKIISIDDVPENLREEVADKVGTKLAKLTVEVSLDKRLAEMRSECEALIIRGIDVDTSHGIRRFSLTTNDQAEIKDCFEMAVKTKADILYHADNLVYESYTYDDIVKIYVEMHNHITYHKTYFNTLKSMMKNMTDPEELKKVEYGEKLPKIYLDQMNKLLKQSKASFAKYMQALGVNI